MIIILCQTLCTFLSQPMTILLVIIRSKMGLLINFKIGSYSRKYLSSKVVPRVPWRCVHGRSVHPFNFFSVSAFLSTRRGPCRSEALSTARAAPGDHEPLIGGARWRSMGELCLGRSVTWSFCRWTYRQGTVPRGLIPHKNLFQVTSSLIIDHLGLGNYCTYIHAPF